MRGLVSVPLFGGAKSDVYQAAHLVRYDCAPRPLSTAGDEIDQIEYVLRSLQDGCLHAFAQPADLYWGSSETINEAVITGRGSRPIADLVKDHRLGFELLFRRHSSQDDVSVASEVASTGGADVVDVRHDRSAFGSPDIDLCTRIARDRLYDFLSRANVRLRKSASFWWKRADQVYGIAKLGDEWPDKITVPDQRIRHLKQGDEGGENTPTFQPAYGEPGRRRAWVFTCRMALKLFTKRLKSRRDLQKVEWLFVLDLEEHGGSVNRLDKGHAEERIVTTAARKPMVSSITVPFPRGDMFDGATSR